jgi:hypothetical protein
VGYQCLNCKKKKNIPSGILLRLFYSSAAVGDWIMKPELSTAHLGIQDQIWSMRKSAIAAHIVYLALSSEVKVGVTQNKYLHDGLIRSHRGRFNSGGA